jgi:AmmeMemoRadiSam system protein B
MEVSIPPIEHVRPPVVEGLFYPDNRAELLAKLHALGLERGKGGQARAIIAPHGAWDISGPIASAAFAAASGRSGRKSPSRVVLLGPLHDTREAGLFLSSSRSFQTPLGNIPVDWETSKAVEACSPLFEENDIPHLGEHSLEVLLPFVKYCFPRAAIVPVLMGQPCVESITTLAKALKTVFEPLIESTLLVVSCNLSKALDETDARRRALEAMRLFTEKKSAELVSALLEERLNICGGAAVASLLQSGLLDETNPRQIAENMFCANDDDNSTVFYGALSFE